MDARNKLLSDIKKRLEIRHRPVDDLRITGKNIYSLIVSYPHGLPIALLSTESIPIFASSISSAESNGESSVLNWFSRKFYYTLNSGKISLLSDFCILSRIFSALAVSLLISQNIAIFALSYARFNRTGWNHAVHSSYRVFFSSRQFSFSLLCRFRYL